MTLKAYFWKASKDENTGIAIIAESAREAKKIGWAYSQSEWCNDYEFIDCVCKLTKDAKDISGLPKGMVEDAKEGLRRGLYGYVEGECCDLCKEEDTLSNVVDGKCLCDGCYEKIEEEEKAKEKKRVSSEGAEKEKEEATKHE